MVVIEAQSDGRARAVESVPVSFAGADQAIAFNPQYLLDGLAAAALTGQGRPPAGPDAEPAAPAGRIRLEFTSPAKPALISWVEGDKPTAAGEAPTGAGGEETRQLTDAGPFRYLVVPVRTPRPA